MSICLVDTNMFELDSSYAIYGNGSQREFLSVQISNFFKIPNSYAAGETFMLKVSVSLPLRVESQAF